MEFTPTASVEAQGVTVQLDTAAGLDVAAERKRAEKDLAAARAEIESVGRKLGNPSFVERAPAEVVAKNRARLAAAEDEVRRLTERLAALPLGEDRGIHRMTTADRAGEGRTRLAQIEREILARRPEHAIDPSLDRIAAL